MQVDASALASRFGLDEALDWTDGHGRPPVVVVFSLSKIEEHKGDEFLWIEGGILGERSFKRERCSEKLARLSLPAACKSGEPGKCGT
jgi:hypothetical protein